MLVEECSVEETLAAGRREQREGESRVTARERLEVDLGLLRRRGADRVDDDDAGLRFRQPVPVGVGSRGGRIRAPHDDAGGIARGTRVEARFRRAVDVVESDVSRLVADGIRVDFGRSEPVEEPQREGVREQRERPGVVGVQDRVRARLRGDRAEAGRDFVDGRVPRDGLELACSLRSDPALGGEQALLGIPKGPVVADRALRTESAPADGMRRVSPDVLDAAVLLDDGDPAGVVTVSRARRQDGLGHERRSYRLGRNAGRRSAQRSA